MYYEHFFQNSEHNIILYCLNLSADIIWGSIKSILHTVGSHWYICYLIFGPNLAATPVSVDPRHEPHRENDVIQSVMSLTLLQMIHANGYRRHIAYSLRDF